MMKLASILLGLVFFCVSCSPSSEPESGTAYREVSVADVKRMLMSDSELPVVVDVRTPREFDAGHLPGAANIDVQSPDFRDKISVMPLDEEIIVYCRSGNRSAEAVRIMQELGFKNILEMKSGWLGWEQSGAAP